MRHQSRIIQVTFEFKEEVFGALVAVCYRLTNGLIGRASDINDEREPKRGRAFKFCGVIPSD